MKRRKKKFRMYQGKILLGGKERMSRMRQKFDCLTVNLK